MKPVKNQVACQITDIIYNHVECKVLKHVWLQIRNKVVAHIRLIIYYYLLSYFIDWGKKFHICTFLGVLNRILVGPEKNFAQKSTLKNLHLIYTLKYKWRINKSNKAL